MAALRAPPGTVINEDGDYVITDYNNHRVQKCPKASPGAACTTVAGTYPKSRGAGATQLDYPTSISDEGPPKSSKGWLHPARILVQNFKRPRYEKYIYWSIPGINLE